MRSESITPSGIFSTPLNVTCGVCVMSYVITHASEFKGHTAPSVFKHCVVKRKDDVTVVNTLLSPHQIQNENIDKKQ